MVGHLENFGGQGQKPSVADLSHKTPCSMAVMGTILSELPWKRYPMTVQCRPT